MRNISCEELEEVLHQHSIWLQSEGLSGKRMVMQAIDFHGCSSALRYANLEKSIILHSTFQQLGVLGINLKNAALKCVNFKDTDLRNSDFSGSLLRGCDFGHACLEGANLQDLRLPGTIGNGREIKSLQLSKFHVVFTKDILQIGDHTRPVSEWWELDDETIDNMVYGALDWWKIQKPILKSIIENNMC